MTYLFVVSLGSVVISALFATFDDKRSYIWAYFMAQAIALALLTIAAALIKL